MKFKNGKNFQTGVAIHLASIPGVKSAGCGEFRDLVELGKWCKSAGLKIIQILPVHDTAENPSPYSAMNAFALNPVYTHLEDISGAAAHESAISEFRKNHQNRERIAYAETYRFKKEILRKIYKERRDQIFGDADLTKWISNNPWIDYYAGYKILAGINQSPAWRTWKIDPVFSTPAGVADDSSRQYNLQKLLKENEDEYIFLAFMQRELEIQLLAAASILDQMGINLKGDLPILMDRESSDVWYHREIFDLRFSAGAPPDQFSTKGQNWGFPVYNIGKLVETNFKWWKARVHRLDMFYHALRLDHVIGYMRIWQVPEGNADAGIGYFSPAAYVDKEARERYGFTPDEFDRLGAPIIGAHNLHTRFAALPGEDFSRIINRYFLELNGFYRLRPEINTEDAIYNLPESAGLKDLLLDIYHSRSLVEVEREEWSPKWVFDKADFFHSLSGEKKETFYRLVHDYYLQSENIWYENGVRFLTAINEASSFLLCGEDLGAVPRVTAKLLDSLDILSLKVLRWTRRYEEPGSPFIPLQEYPLKSVATTSVHDSDNIRQWWKDDHEARNLLRQTIREFTVSSPNDDSAPYTGQNENGYTNGDLDAITARQLIRWFLSCQSRIAIIPLQDLLALWPAYRIADPARERINIPGQILDTNWNYKIPAILESITSDAEFTKEILRLTSPRSAREIPKTRPQDQDSASGP